MNLSITHRRKDQISLGLNANIEIIPETTYPSSPQTLMVPGATTATFVLPEESQFGKSLMDSMMLP